MPPSSSGSTRLCAEALAGIADPLFPALITARPAAPDACARAVFRALVEPLECPPPADVLPAWLLPHQVDAVVRARAILRRFGGVLIADGVGLGKTWIGLALALLEHARGGDAAVVVPAALAADWRRAAQTAGVSLTLHSHAILSRRAPPAAARCTLVIVDEAHAFRNPRTRRYDHLATLTAGRRVALLTATPLNNTPADLAALVHLFAPRDRFREFGVPDLGEALARGDPAAALALGAIAVCRTRRLVEARFPELRGRFPRRVLLPPVHYDLASCYGDDLPSVLEALAAFVAAVGEQRGAALLHLTLLRRLESGRVALRRSLARHRDILDEVVRAGEQGIRLSRADARSAISRNADEAQLAMWPLLSAHHGEPAWDRLAAARRAADRVLALVDEVSDRPDAKADALEVLLDGPLRQRKAIVFTEHRDTALHLLRRLRRSRRVLAVLGDGAWAASGAIRRRDALDAFAPVSRNAARRPLLDADILLATDVVSEGLNLQDASAVVNYDLPWNPVRVMQRVGRIDRLQSPHREIAVAHLVPAAGLAHLAQGLRVLRGKLESTTLAVGAEPDPLAALWWLDRPAPHGDALDEESWRRVAPFEARERWRMLAGAPSRGTGAPLIAAATDDAGPPAAGILLEVVWPRGQRIPLPWVAIAGQPPRRDPQAMGQLAERLAAGRRIEAQAADFTGVLATVLSEARGVLVELSAARRGGVEPGGGRRAALDRLARAGAEAHRARADSRVIAQAIAALGSDLPAGFDRLLGRLSRESGDGREFAARVVELSSRLASPGGPSLEGTPRLVLVAAFLIVNSCPSG